MNDDIEYEELNMSSNLKDDCKEHKEGGSGQGREDSRSRAEGRARWQVNASEISRHLLEERGDRCIEVGHDLAFGFTAGADVNVEWVPVAHMPISFITYKLTWNSEVSGVVVGTEVEAGHSIVIHIGEIRCSSITSLYRSANNIII